MKPPALVTLLFSLLAGITAHAQTPAPAKYRICMDVGHQQRFWRDPADMPGMDAKMIERVKYMTGELVKTTTSVNASLSYLKKEVNPKTWKGATCCSSTFLRQSTHPVRSAPSRNTSPAAVRCSW